MPLGEQLMTLPTFKIVAVISPGKKWFLLLIRLFYGGWACSGTGENLSYRIAYWYCSVPPAT